MNSAGAAPQNDTRGPIWGPNTSIFTDGNEVFRIDYPLIERWHTSNGKWHNSTYDLSNIEEIYILKIERCDAPGGVTDSYSKILICEEKISGEKIIISFNLENERLYNYIEISTLCAESKNQKYEIKYQLFDEGIVVGCENFYIFDQFLDLVHKVENKNRWKDWAFDGKMYRFFTAKDWSVHGGIYTFNAYEPNNIEWLGRGFGLPIYSDENFVISGFYGYVFIGDIDEKISKKMTNTKDLLVGPVIAGKHLISRPPYWSFRKIEYLNLINLMSGEKYKLEIYRNGNRKHEYISPFGAKNNTIVTPLYNKNKYSFKGYNLNNRDEVLFVEGSNIIRQKPQDRNEYELRYDEMYQLYTKFSFNGGDMDELEIATNIDEFLGKKDFETISFKCLSKKTITYLHSIRNAHFHNDVSTNNLIRSIINNPSEIVKNLISNQESISSLRANRKRLLHVTDIFITYRDKIKSTVNWQKKFQSMNPSAYSLDTLRKFGFPISNNTCMLESGYYDSFELELWIYSFWYRRYLDGTFEIVSSILESFKRAEYFGNKLITYLSSGNKKGTYTPEPPDLVQAKTPASPRSTIKDAIGKSYAIVIGNNHYRAMPKLNTAVKDAMAVGRELETRFGFSVSYLVDATRSEILNELNLVNSELGSDDQLLIYYAGHGHRDELSGKAYWQPLDANRSDDTNWIISDRITALLRKSRAKQVLIVADSCYSGTLLREGIGEYRSNDLAARLWDKKSRILIASGGDEPVDDGGGDGHSVFAKYFLAGLREEKRRIFTADELFYQHIKRPVAGNAAQIPEFHDIRNSGHEGGSFLFVRQ